MFDVTRPTSLEYRREFLKVESPKPLTRQLLRGYSRGKYKVDEKSYCPIFEVWTTTFSRIVKVEHKN